ncbi:hypothetical protein DFP72DRAFT_859493 [Ephemerocybe angulata]|uniref:Uncharacterized protein n=1 Tax=Ephemerocybe angulata TaxID=980116 RepID=A0A8H6HAY8_9AGAR|nr:hypothetical protein DFP72DRAFT_859493 [Tulosesus angulatus]
MLGGIVHLRGGRTYDRLDGLARAGVGRGWRDEKAEGRRKKEKRWLSRIAEGAEPSPTNWDVRKAEHKKERANIEEELEKRSGEKRSSDEQRWARGGKLGLRKEMRRVKEDQSALRGRAMQIRGDGAGEGRTISRRFPGGRSGADDVEGAKRFAVGYEARAGRVVDREGGRGMKPVGREEQEKGGRGETRKVLTDDYEPGCGGDGGELGGVAVGVNHEVSVEQATGEDQESKQHESGTPVLKSQAHRYHDAKAADSERGMLGPAHGESGGGGNERCERTMKKWEMVSWHGGRFEVERKTNERGESEGAKVRSNKPPQRNTTCHTPSYIVSPTIRVRRAADVPKRPHPTHTLRIRGEGRMADEGEKESERRKAIKYRRWHGIFRGAPRPQISARGPEHKKAGRNLPNDIERSGEAKEEKQRRRSLTKQKKNTTPKARSKTYHQNTQIFKRMHLIPSH